DYRPETISPQKLKKQADTLTITFVRNPDILAEVAQWQPRPFTVGFAAETEELESHARTKLEKKGLDLVIANPVGEPGAGFGEDQNRVTLIDRDRTVAWTAAPKTEIARQIVTEIIKRLPRNTHA
ncbi:MAG: phosphopantothenoylcysteine decarboxylase domain-containing protein, partial [Acidiferrobacter sp.]